MNLITVIILAKNEEKNIGECLRSISRCDEMIVIDDMSEDRTAEIAEKYGAKVYKNKLKNFSEQRNFGLEKAKNEWVLFIDADERISQALWYEIDNSVNYTIEKIDGFYIKRNDVLWGKKLKYGENVNTKFIRLAKKDAGRWKGAVHEQWIIKGKTKMLNHALSHYPHQSLEEFLNEINYYTDIRAEEIYKTKKSANWFDIMMYPAMKFVQNFLIRRGFLDGMPGLITAIMMSFHSFLVRGKLWMLCSTKTKI